MPKVNITIMGTMSDPVSAGHPPKPVLIQGEAEITDQQPQSPPAEPTETAPESAS